MGHYRQAEVIRYGKGPECVSRTLLSWVDQRHIRIEHIQPGQPQQNAYVERNYRTVRYDWLAQTLFDFIDKVQYAATQWLWIYNHERPNTAIGEIIPAQALSRHFSGQSALAAQLHFGRQLKMC